VSDGVWVIDNFSPRSYYHWMTECLPRLLVAERLRVSSRLILPAYFRAEPYVLFTVDAFPAIETIEWIGKPANVAVGRLVCPTRLAPPGEYSRELGEVAARVSARVEGTGPRRLYLRRSGSSRRQIVNQAAVTRVLEEHGFEVLEINPADPAQQIRAVRSADSLVGVHGAELTNIMFQARGARVVELRHGDDTRFWNCYAPLAEAFDIGYQSLRCNVAPGQERLANSQEINHADLVVDIDALEEIVATTVTRSAPSGTD
jgi:capsular polysaccharide biosynthesis protein